MLIQEEANESAPDQSPEGPEEERVSEESYGGTADEAGYGESDKDPEPKGFVHENDDRILLEGGGVALDVGLEVVENPAGVGVPKAFEGAVGVVVIVRVGVMLDMGGGPVEGGALHGHGAPD